LTFVKVVYLSYIITFHLTDFLHISGTAQLRVTYCCKVMLTEDVTGYGRKLQKVAKSESS